MSKHTQLTALALATLTATGVDCVIRDAEACGETVVLNDNGAWSWFEDERAVVDDSTDTLLVSSVADASGSGGVDRDGNVEVAAYDLAAGTSRRTVLHRRLEADDHNSAALYVRPDGRYVAAYSRHTTDSLTRWTVSDGSGGSTTWGAEQTFDHGAPTTYSNLYEAAETGRLYNFVRTDGRDPHFLVSDDDGSTWKFGGRLLSGDGRPYVRYAVDARGRIHFIVTEQHPADFGNSLYHGVIEDERLLTSHGDPVDLDLTDRSAVRPEQLTTVFAGSMERRAWAIDLQIDADGHPYAAFSVRSLGGLSYHYARFDGTGWHVTPLADAGRGLYPAESHYTGLVALDPRNPSRLVMSTDADPDTSAPLISLADGRRHYELFEGITADAGATWSWTRITTDSTIDNLRPIIPRSDGSRSIVLWLRGTYSTYHDYDLDVVGRIGDRRTCERAGMTAAKGPDTTGAPGVRISPNLAAPSGHEQV